MRLPLLAAVALILVTKCSADGHGANGLECEESKGWFKGWDKCYKVFHGDHIRSYHRAEEMCASYGSRLVTIKDQTESDYIGKKFTETVGTSANAYYIGLAKKKTDACSTCTELRWSNGMAATDIEGFWSDNEPDDADGQCVFARKNDEDYFYDRPYAFSYCNCMILRAFICEKMAAPEGSFFCHNKGYINRNNVCDGRNDCEDGSDELNCPNNCRYYHTGDDGTLGTLVYRDAMTCTWAIETSPGTNAVIQFDTFNTEYNADFVTVMVGSFDESEAMIVGRISGNVGKKTYRSYNNKIFIKFFSDSSVSNTGSMTGFTGTYGSLKVSSNQVTNLIARNNPQEYSISTFDVENTRTFLGQRDYVIVISTENNYQFGQMITLEVLDLQLADGDTVMFFDHQNPQDLLSTSCNDAEQCKNHRVIYSTDKKLSILLRTNKMVNQNMAFRFRYRQGCYYETTDVWGTIYTPGYTGNINYPSFVSCVWQITTTVPISIYFDSSSRLQSNAHNRKVNGDFLKIYEDGQMLAGSPDDGYSTNDFAGKVFNLKKGVTRLQLDSSVTRSERGFLATWSPACPDPLYDENTIVNPSPLKTNYRDITTVTCKTGYAFQQEQIAAGITSVTIECGYKGVWKNYRQVPRCTPRYCGDVPVTPNSVIVSSTGTVYGSKVIYKCNAGTVASGNLEIMCRADGTWENAPVCRAASCPSGVITDTILNGEGERKVGDGTSIGTIYEYKCNDGYEFVGKPYIICKDDATWSQSTVPTCKLLTCLLPSIMNAGYSGYTVGQLVNVGVEVLVTCNNGYKFATNSPQSVKCNTDRTLTALPQCIDVDECENTNTCAVKCQNTVGSYFCSCDKGFILSTFDRRSCNNINECLGEHNCDGNCVDSPGSYRCECTAPYVLYDEDLVSGYAIPRGSGELGNLPTDTYHVNHSCVLLTCPTPKDVANGKILTKRVHHRYGDHVEYICNIGFLPRRIVRECGINGQWSGSEPKCEPQQCVESIPSPLKTTPTTDSGPNFAYNQRLTLQCKVGDNTFNRYRFCTYNPSNDKYEMQGSPYECGEIDCGTPKQESGSNYILPTSTTLGSSFEFTCTSADTREGTTQAGSVSQVFCLKEGYWDFGNLQCTGLKCLDPGYPPDGDIIVNSFADKSTVKFKCLKSGYSLSTDVTLTCNGDTFSNNAQVPTCIDTEKPVFTNCPTGPITLQKYASLSDRLKSLPQVTVSDNTAVRTFTVTPSNVNSTYFLSENVRVVYRATDFAGNEATCEVDVVVADEVPPVINCPDDRFVYLETDQDVKTYEKLKLEDVVPSNQRDEIASFFVSGEPTELRVTDLYKTYTFSIQVQDKSGNRALCQQQVFVRPLPCSELSYPTPLNAKKVCSFNGNIRTCTLTCDDQYTFDNGKTKTVTCSGGSWGNTPWIPACVRDIIPPVVTCPSPVTINDFFKKTDEKEIDFAATHRSSVIIQDFNTYGEPVFSPSTYKFTQGDAYKQKVVTVSVTDTAGNTGFCTFQYTVIPAVCSELSLLTPTDGSISGTRRAPTSSRVAGWDVKITCNAGKILRNVGASKTVSCNDGSPWSDADIFPTCIDDTAGPTLSCPQSREESLSTGNEERTIVFENSADYVGTASDLSGIGTRTYSPASLNVNFNRLNTVTNIALTVTDKAGNPTTCNFQVAIIAQKCSPLALPDPINGQKQCTPTTNGWSCTFSCNTGYSFYSTTQSQITTSCQNGGDFVTYVPDCARNDDTTNRKYIGKMRYDYVPTSSSITGISSICTTTYKNKMPPILNEMTTRLRNSCSNNFGPFTSEFVLEFLPDITEVSIASDGITVSMIFSYTIVYERDTSIYEKCAVSFLDDIGKSGNTFPLSRNISASGTCPELQWNDIAVGAGRGPFCEAPYFQSLTDDTKCVKCPAGTQSNGVQCSLCPKGTYRTYTDSSCIACQTGYTTRYPGATSQGQCIAPCSGSVSTTGFSPCRFCQKGFYRLNSQSCQSCGTGQTTVGDNALSQDQCVPSTVDDVPCTVGTQLDGNTCVPCPVGTYRSVNSQTCVDCPLSGTSTYMRGATSSSQCLPTCQQGYISSTGRAPCTPCPLGQYATTTTSCTACPTGYTTTYRGQSSCIEAVTLKLKCPRGTSRDVNDRCVNCIEGTFNANEEGQCSSCQSSDTTFFAGATASTMCRSKCPPGFFSATGKAPCQACGIGRYSSTFGATQCTPCSVSDDTITATTTSTSVSQCKLKCDEGFFSFNGFNLNEACRRCPQNHYQSLKGQTSCSQCNPSSLFSTSTGLTSSSQCQDANSRCNNYCQNGGTCSIRNNEPVCDCIRGRYFGPQCASEVNHCSSNPCYNSGVCSNTATGYTCDCRNLATGTRCETLVKRCVTGATPTCKNGGHCINRLNSFQCMCTEGYSGTTNCEQRVNICDSSPCSSTGTLNCVDVSLGSNLRRRCICRPGYTGETCADQVDECASNPCINGGICRNQLNFFTCDCQPGYSGTYCEVRQDTCASNNCRVADASASCVDDYNSNKHMCICNSQYTYDLDGKYAQYTINLNTAPNNLADFSDQNLDTVVKCRTRCTELNAGCKWFAFDTGANKCYIWNAGVNLSLGTNVNVNLYTKSVVYPTDDFYTPRYNFKSPTPSSPTDTETLAGLRNYGLDICAGTEPLSARCCQVGQTCLDNRNLPAGLTCNTQTGLSYPFANADYDIQFKCSVSRVFKSMACKQKTDFCSSLNPCQNGAACVNQFGGYRCNCVAGYTGKNCQTNMNDCANDPCRNGAKCVDQVNGYKCECTNFYTGTNCESPENFCLTNRCNGHGTCANVPGSGYKCTCFTGYEGTDCETKIDYCKSDPCQHGGTCNGNVGGYTCSCLDGWQGTNCETAIKKCLDVNAGGKCQGECYNIFNGYSCKCNANRFGTDCENERNPCRDYNKCQNGGVCAYDTSMKCNCLTKYTGDGCQTLVDYCGKTNPCKNDAMCTVTDTGYRCTCKQGYEGINCENEVNDCPGDKCPNGGDCYDGVNTYYCRCPIQKTGTNCQKDVDVNYDLSFYHPRGYGFAWIPYYIQVTTVNYISTTLWVRYSTAGAKGVYMTQFVGDRFEDSSRFMEFEERGVKIYIERPNANYALLEYDREAVINDGNWHLVAITCDMVKGIATLSLDTILHDTVVDSDLIMPNVSFRQWIVLGCEFDNEDRRCMENGKGFRGYLSQINWYTRLLSFQGPDDNTVGDIPRIFIQPRFVFQDLRFLLLAWNEYVFESGVGKMTPSEANGVPCNDNTRSPACSSYRATSQLPSVTNCPEDKVVYSEERITQVTWDEPVFHNIGTGRIIKPSRPSGSSFTWGIYRNTYIGIDNSNNKAYCHFTVYVTAGKCDRNPDPRGGSQSCNSQSGRTGCTISCNNVNTNTYMVDRDHPDLFTCGPTGWWNSDKPFRKFRYPSCGLIKAMPKMQAYIRVNYRMITAACIASKRNINVRTYEALNAMKAVFSGSFCQQADCKDAIVIETCGPTTQRKKRQTSSFTTVLLEITLPLIDSMVVFDGETITSEEFLTYFILGAEILNFSDTIPNLTLLKENFKITMTAKCPAGEVLRDGQCIGCGPGNYFRYTDNTNTTAICDDCPLGYYQDTAGAMNCKKCTDGLTTELTGEFLDSSCKKSCPVGQYFNNAINNCEVCPIGYYQDEVGQFRCKGCQAGETTKETGSTSSLQCSISCDSGSELNNNGGCDLCEIGQYRDAATSRVCLSCDPGFITASKGARLKDDCKIVDCQAGSYRNVTENKCYPCPLNTYQDQKWKESCVSCGDVANWRTASTGSTSKSQCLYYCPSGFEVNTGTGNTCDICPVEEYKDNTVDPQGRCTTCPGNKVSLIAGAKSASDCTIYKCFKGSVANSANNGCNNCSIGYYQDEDYKTECKKCDESYSTKEEGATSKNACEMHCPDGEEMIDGICKKCKKGFYKNNLDGVFELCKSCDSRYTTGDVGSTSAAACNIRTCPAGTKRDATDTGCDPCPRGTYQPDAFQKDCIPCKSGTSTRMMNSTKETDCESYCESGSEKVSGQCSPCDRGYFKDNSIDNFSPCTLCPTDYITESTGATSESLCVVGNCSAGQYLKTDKTCANCPKGQYQPMKWQTSCLDCGQDKTTETDGASKQSECIVECSPGFEDDNGVCKECPRGTYKVERAAAKCKPCPTGLTTVGTGATTAALCTLPACTAGKYLDKITNPTKPECKPCAYDFYQDEIWQEQCKPCQDNKVTLRLGADKVTDCVSDCDSGLQYDSNSGQCVFCPRGYYRNKNDRLQPQCQLCPIDKITTGEGGKDLTECTDANCTLPGEYRDTASNTCKKCPIGTYNSEKWVVSCKDCPRGNSTRTVGATVIADCVSICPLGYYVGSDNKCEMCLKGYYRNDTTTEQCTKCPDGRTTEGPGADSESKCSISRCLAGYKYVNNLDCVKCEIGTYQPNAGSFQCIDCPFSIKYTPSDGATSEDDCRSPCEAGKQFDVTTKSCVPCPVGTFQPKSFEFTCLQCPVGRKFTSETGSRSIDNCLSYCSASAANACSINATCTVSDTNSLGYTCQCFPNYDSIGLLTGRECVHKCDRNFCKNGATCVREPKPSCTCTKWYDGDDCAIRRKAEELSDNTMDIVIPVTIAVGGLILVLIILAVCCLCWRRGQPVKGPEPQYSEFNGERFDKGSTHSFSMPYNSRPPSRLMMLQPAHEIVYDNKAYLTDNHSVIDTSMIDAAVYEA